MKTARRLLGSFIRDERGLETVEYAIIAGLIVAATIATIASIGYWVSARFTDLEEALETGSGGE
ncbi:MAG: Flp family type IVb pilin [Phycisphaerae bacterium]|nr:Flp family type IVb pilin [Phycisphaerae bacterium]